MRENAVAIGVGVTGGGKTTMIRQYADKARRIIVVDPEGKWRFSSGSAIEVETGDDLLAALDECGAADPANPFRIIYRSEAASRMKLAGPAAAFAYRNLTLCIDELVWLCTQRSLPDYLMRLLQVGRERRVNLLATTRSPAEVPSMIFEQASMRWFFRMEPGPALETVARRYGFSVEALRTLPLCENGRLTGKEFFPYGEAGTLDHFGREGLALKRATLHTSPHNKRRRGGE